MARAKRYTVVTNKSGLGRWVGKAEALRIAALWRSLTPSLAVRVLDESGNVLAQ